MERLRVGFIGAGGNTRMRHLPGFRSIENVECSVVCNRSEESSSAVAKAFEISAIARHWEEVIASPEIDAICIGTWPCMHAPITIAALNSGKHVLTEARMAMNASEAREMRDVAAAHPDLVAQIVPAPFSLEFDATISQILPQLGELREVRIRHLNAQHLDPKTPLTWRQEFALSGVNTMALGILYETVQRWLGNRDPIAISATARTFVTERPAREGHGRSAVTIPDSVGVMATYSCGAGLFADVSSVWHGSPVSEIKIDCSEGSLRFDLNASKLFVCESRDVREREVRPDPGTQRGWNVEADFVSSIRTGAPVTLTSFRDGLRYMAFTDLAWRSWNSGGVPQAWRL